jgi:Zn finger protein HypA/HybF involved in hydrogenase expression
MHEQYIAQQLIDAAKKEAKQKSGNGSFREIVVEVGELGHIPAHDLEHYFRAFPWKTTITERPSTVHCTACGFRGRPNILEKSHDLTLFDCPKCGKLPKIIDGHDIKLVKVVL